MKGLICVLAIVAVLVSCAPADACPLGGGGVAVQSFGGFGQPVFVNQGFGFGSRAFFTPNVAVNPFAFNSFGVSPFVAFGGHGFRGNAVIVNRRGLFGPRTVIRRGF